MPALIPTMRRQMIAERQAREWRGHAIDAAITLLGAVLLVVASCGLLIGVFGS